MAIPDFQSIMLPLLQFTADGREHSMKESVEAVGKNLKLTREEMDELLPSGSVRIFANRVAWAKSSLSTSGLLETPRRGVFIISALGLKVLSEKPERITLKYLKQLDSQGGAPREKKKEKREKEPQDSDQAENEKKTPEEMMEDGYNSYRSSLISEILDTVKKSSPEFFERVVLDLLLAMGYGESREASAKALGKTGDEGVDGVIAEDKLGLDVIYIQAKRWTETPVGRQEIQAFVGALQGKRARKGIFITTSRFTKDARNYAENIETRVILIEGERLAELMIDHGVGVGVRRTYEIKRVDSDYFAEE